MSPENQAMLEELDCLDDLPAIENARKVLADMPEWAVDAAFALADRNQQRQYPTLYLRPVALALVAAYERGREEGRK